MKSIKAKILKSFLTVSIASLVLTGLLSEIVMFNLRGTSTSSNRQIGLAAADSSETALTNQALEDASALATAKADIISERLSQAAGDLELIASYVNYLYTHRESFNLIPYSHSRECPPGVLSMQWLMSPGMSFEDVREETYLHGNMESVYSAVMQNNPNIMGIYLTTETGINSGYDAYAQTKPEEFEGRTSGWYVNARDAGALVYSETYQDSFGRGLTLSLSAPCYGAGNRFIGVLGMDILIEDLNDMVTQTVVGESGYAVLLFSEDDPAPEPGPEYHVITETVEATGWRLAFVLPVADILAPAYAARAEIERLTDETARSVDRQILYSNLVLIGLFVAVIVFVIWTTARISLRITQPITTLERELGGIAGGNLDTVIDIKTGDEIERLGNSVNAMTTDLKAYIANLAHVTAEKERIGAELDVATKIQSSMLPSIFPAFPERAEFDVYASMQPAKEVGGDFYDFFLIDEKTLAVVMADVSGKGVPAALFMVIAKTLIKNNAQYGKTPAEVFGTVNNLLCENNEAGMFVTAFMGYLDIPSGKFTFVNAGHNPPLLKAGDRWEWLKVKKNFILAGMEDTRYTQMEITLNRGDGLFLYTDGVTEAMNNEKKLFSDPRLLETANSHPEQDLKEFTLAIKREIDAFAQGAEQADDITMLALRYKGDTNG